MTSVHDLTTTSGEQREPKLYPQFILFGDSITQGSNADLVSALSNYYIRRLDVINRGFSGYTALMGLKILPRFFPATVATTVSLPQVRLMTVFFGANDACLPGQDQNVPLETYKDTLRQIANYQGVKLHSTQVIFITPPPVDEHQLMFAGNALQQSRTAENTARYAAACRDVAASLQLPFLDLWTVIMAKAGWKRESPGEKLIGSKDRERSPVLDELLDDGLHLSSKGYSVLWHELKTLIETELPDQVPEKVPMVYPNWSDALHLNTK